MPAETQLTLPAYSWRESALSASGVRTALIAALVLFIYWQPIRHTLVGRWISDANWSHGWLIPLFSLYFLHSRREQLQRCRAEPSYLGALVLALSLGFFFWSAWWARMAYPQALSLIGVLFGLVLLLGGWPVLRVAWFPIAYLVLAVPLPHRFYSQLTIPLRILASKVSAALLPLLVPGLHTDAQAVVIDYVRPGFAAGQLNVEEACSGMRSLMAIVTLGIAVTYLGQRPFWQRLVLLAACLPIALFCNVVRVTTTGYFTVTGHREWAQGTPHEILGLGMLVLAGGLFLLVSYVLNNLFVDAPESQSH